MFELAREGIVNALVHRDYGIEGAKCQLIVTPDTIVVKSPGLPVPPIALQQMQSFSAPMLSRNPVLHYVFARMELAEERGFGLKTAVPPLWRLNGGIRRGHSKYLRNPAKNAARNGGIEAERCTCHV